MSIALPSLSPATAALWRKNLLFYAVFCAIVILAAVLRCHDLVSRPLHNDEGVNFYFLQNIARAGYYEYSHENYHGPAFFYWSYLWYTYFGADEIGVRFSAAITGVLTLLLLLPLRRSEGDLFVCLAALLLSLSPSNVYYSRYAIHETLFVFASLGGALSIYLWSRYDDRRCLVGGFFFLALLMATKETFIVTLFCIGVAALSLAPQDSLWRCLEAQKRHILGAVALAFATVLFLLGVRSFSPALWLGIVADAALESRTSTALTNAIIGSGVFGGAALYFGRSSSSARTIMAGIFLASSALAYGVWLKHMAVPPFAIFALCGFALSTLAWGWRRQPLFLYQIGYFGAFVIGSGLGLFSKFADLPLFLASAISGLLLLCLGAGILPLGNHFERLKLLYTQRKQLFWGALLGVVSVSAWFSGGFQWTKGIDEILQGVPQWISRNDSDHGHFKPFWYYAERVVGQSEPWLALVLVLPLLAFLFLIPARASFSTAPRSLHFARFSTCWAVISFVVYSALNYKTPWLAINFTAPAALACAAWLSIFWQAGAVWNGASVLLLGSIIGGSVYYNKLHNFEVTFGQFNPFSYVHTSQGMLDLRDDIDYYKKAHPAARILVGVDGYWPLPFYLRQYDGQIGYQKTTEPTSLAREDSIILLDKNLTWQPPKSQWAKKYYRLSDVAETYVYFLVGQSEASPRSSP